jgi:hypothetical protein
MLRNARESRKSDAVITAISAADRTGVRTLCEPVLLRLLAVAVLAVTVPAAASADPSQMKPDRGAIGALLDQFIPDVVAQKDLKAGWELTGGVARTTSRREWLRGNTSIERYPAKGTRFHGFIVNYAYPGDVGFDILVQPTTPSLGARSFRAEAQKLGGRWKITTWYPVATYAPAGKTQTVIGPADFGPANGAAPGGSARLGAWALLVPVLLVGGFLAVGLALAGAHWRRNRARVRALERQLARSR